MTQTASAPPLKQFLDNETAVANQASFSAALDLAADERRIRDALLSTLPDMFDQSLAARRATGDSIAVQQGLSKLRAAVAAAVLSEVRLRTGTLDHELPAAFIMAFEGTGVPDSWFDLFVRDAAFRLKEDAGFERVWNAEQLALAKAVATAHTAVLEEINERTKRLQQGQEGQTAMLRELLALARSGGVFPRAAEQGVPEAVRSIIERLGGEGIARDDLIPWLDNWIEAAREELDRYTNEGEAFDAARREAERRFKAGYLNEASAAFMDELAREERGEAERQAERKRRRIRLLEEAVRYDELALNIPAVISKLRMMADIEGITDPDIRSKWLLEKAAEFNERGSDKGINASLVVAIAVCRVALQELSRERVPLQWAATQCDLGSALATLGERESGTDRLEEAIKAYRDVLQEWTREHVPLDWAMAQHNLGAVLATLGGRESGTARLEEAVTAYRNALQERTRERVPLRWAATQGNLGNALRSLGERESGTARLEEAIKVYRDALQELIREHVPLVWAMTQNNLGSALQSLGQRESGAERLEEAIKAYRDALQERTSERVPLQWAATQCNLGSALQGLGERESSTARLEEAVTAYRDALQERTRDRVPLQWAMTHNNLGNALQSLCRRVERTRCAGGVRVLMTE